MVVVVAGEHNAVETRTVAAAVAAVSTVVVVGLVGTVVVVVVVLVDVVLVVVGVWEQPCGGCWDVGTCGDCERPIQTVRCGLVGGTICGVPGVPGVDCRKCAARKRVWPDPRATRTPRRLPVGLVGKSGPAYCPGRT